MADRYVAIMKAVAATEDISCLDINRVFREAANGDEERLAALYLDGMHPNRRGQALIAREILAWLYGDPARLAKRSPYADRVAHLDSIHPEPHSRHPGNAIPVRVCAPGHAAVARLQYRAKPYSGAPRDFGAWRDVAADSDQGCYSGSIRHDVEGLHAFQFRLVKPQGDVLAVGGVEHVTLGSD